ncbi:MAG: sodium:proton antiporter [Bacteroidetes bacterium GWF2_43_63]|nr:MAG: sodium:proton antiporter [Bacteroidetes bacterium GWE2_42_42]OFY53301.1 MAG: sodium:proton antiporter [Bacteroidetes bacterium GWF2_43_63]HBG71705.1 sodium:proton antiporter [Bacteroidales bacterium]HCB61630.1 sodium:proton antiporter [Bacteroidales bacterium]HCY22842.1 sodium:proton antiporter [Bacteroidales bacterium]
MTTSIIITLCVLILISYIFDLTSARTKIPSVILLLLIGWLLRQIAIQFNINVPDLTEALPVIGTIGLILIVLEGSMDLELNRSKKKVVIHSTLMAFLPMLILGAGLAIIVQNVTDVSFKTALINVIPLCVISSAIAIPSAQLLSKANRELVTYESSLSDIIGVVIFNFVALNDSFGWLTFGNFFLQILITLAISFVGIMGLSVLLHSITHHVKFVPIIMLIILLYAITKILHLPGLIFIMLFGIFLANLELLRKVKWVKVFHIESLKKEHLRFKEIVAEGSFLIRTLFFLLFGFMIETEDLLDTESLPWAMAITAAIFIIRLAFMKLLKITEKSILFIAPRGLITILLFLSIAQSDKIGLISTSLVIQIVIITALFMMFGLMQNKKTKAKPHETPAEPKPEEPAGNAAQ